MSQNIAQLHKRGCGTSITLVCYPILVHISRFSRSDRWILCVVIDSLDPQNIFPCMCIMAWGQDQVADFAKIEGVAIKNGCSLYLSYIDFSQDWQLCSGDGRLYGD